MRFISCADPFDMAQPDASHEAGAYGGSSILSAVGWQVRSTVTSSGLSLLVKPFLTTVSERMHNKCKGQKRTRKVSIPGWLRDSRRYVKSEEHTSELQSHSDLVCRLLLEKKKQSGRPDSTTGYTNHTSSPA